MNQEYNKRHLNFPIEESILWDSFNEASNKIYFLLWSISALRYMDYHLTIYPWLLLKWWHLGQINLMPIQHYDQYTFAYIHFQCNHLPTSFHVCRLLYVIHQHSLHILSPRLRQLILNYTKCSKLQCFRIASLLKIKFKNWLIFRLK